MKTYPYNRASSAGRRLFKLLDAQFNPSVLDATKPSNTFQSYEVPSVTQCRVNKMALLFPSNLSGVKRPQVKVEADIEAAWGAFTEDVTELDFTHDGQELPLSYVQPLEDDTMNLLIDAGLYREERFEEIMNKLMEGEVFDAEADIHVTYLDASHEKEEGHVPVLLVDPVSVVHDGYDPSEQTTIANLVKRSAYLALELQKEGVKTEELVRVNEPEQDREVFLSEQFHDVIAEKAQEQASVPNNTFTAASELLDEEIDVTNELKGSLSFDHTTEDDRIRDLKEKDREENDRAISSESDAKQELETSVIEQEEQEVPSQVTSTTRIKETSTVLGADLFEKGLDDYEYESEEDGPSL